MGFDTSAAHLIWFFAILGVASAAMGASFSYMEDRAEAQETLHAHLRERLHTRMDGGWFCHDADAQVLYAHALNAGRTDLSLGNVTLVVDGEATTGWTAAPEDAAESDLWPSGEEADFQRAGHASDPARLLLVTERGVAHYAEKRAECPRLTSIVVTPATVGMQIGGTQDFTAQGYDQYGEPLQDLAFVWSEDGAGTLSTLGDGSVRLTAGTVSGTYQVSATVGLVSGAASVTVHPGPALSLTVSPDPVDVAAGGTQAFTVTGLDAYGNVNSSLSDLAWSTDAGSITSGGVLTAQSTAQTGRVVTATSGSLSDSAVVNVVPGPVSRVALTPSSVTLLTQGAQSFGAVAYDAYDNVVPGATFTWSATRGAITSAGAYTAPSTTGADTVTATTDGVSGAASVTVTKHIHVDALQTYKDGVATSAFAKRDTIETRVTVRDHLGNLVAGATVTIELRNPSNGLAANLTGTTDATGVASISYSIPANAPQGAWTDRVTLLSGTDLVYNDGANVVTQVGFTVG